MQVCVCVCSFLVAALPKRLCGGNTACGCPCPSLSLIIFYHARFLSYSLSFSGAPLSPPFPPRLCLSALLFFAQSVAAAWASHRGTRQNFPSTFLPLFLHIPPAALFFLPRFCPPFSSSIFIPARLPAYLPVLRYPSHLHLPSSSWLRLIRVKQQMPSL